MNKELKELIVGNWYFSINPKKPKKLLFCFSGRWGVNTQYGFDFVGSWSGPNTLCVYQDSMKDYIIAKDAEVYALLRHEAVQRGYSLGVAIKWKDGRQGIIDSEMYFVQDDKCIAVQVEGSNQNNNLPLMLDGVWVDIVNL